MDIQKLYQEAIQVTSIKHTEKRSESTGDRSLPYDVHISNVAMEILIAGFNTDNFNTAFLYFRLTLLHDTIEDTATDFQELKTSLHQK